MLCIEFAMLKIDLLGSYPLPFFFAIFMWALLLGIDISLIPVPEGNSWEAILLILGKKTLPRSIRVLCLAKGVK